MFKLFVQLRKVNFTPGKVTKAPIWSRGIALHFLQTRS